MTDAKTRFLVALRGYRQQFQSIRCPADLVAVNNLDQAFHDIDWDATDFKSPTETPEEQMELPF